MAKQQKSQKGQGLVEYALIVVLICIVAIVILTTVGPWSKKSNSGGFLAPSPAYAAEEIYVAEPDPPFGSRH